MKDCNSIIDPGVAVGHQTVGVIHNQAPKYRGVPLHHVTKSLDRMNGRLLVKNMMCVNCPRGSKHKVYLGLARRGAVASILQALV